MNCFSYKLSVSIQQIEKIPLNKAAVEREALLNVYFFEIKRFVAHRKQTLEKTHLLEEKKFFLFCFFAFPLQTNISLLEKNMKEGKNSGENIEGRREGGITEQCLCVVTTT